MFLVISYETSISFPIKYIAPKFVNYTSISHLIRRCRPTTSLRVAALVAEQPQPVARGDAGTSAPGDQPPAEQTSVVTLEDGEDIPATER